MMVSFIKIEAWPLHPTLTPDSTMNPMDAAKQEPIYFYLRMILHPSGMNLSFVIAHIIKLVMTSAAEAELGALFITAKEIIPLQQTLYEIGCLQPPSPVQDVNSTAEGIVNNTIVPRKIKSMDLRFYRLRCQ